MRVAVIGGGVFGATAAVDFARAGARVDLFEAKPDLLGGATSHCQARLHAGYHYPRSDSTAAAARDGFGQFAARYPQAIRRVQHHYVIADDSQVSAAEYLAFCDRLGLPYEVVDSPFVHHAQVVLRVPEAFVDVDVLRRLLRRDLHQAGIRAAYNTWAEPEALRGYDLTVVATYGQPWSRPLRYEVCEVALLELGRYSDSFVVLDGPFVSLDPSPAGYMLYDVANSVHHVSVGYGPEVPDRYLPLIDRWGPVQTHLSHVQVMVDTAGRNLRGVEFGGRNVCFYKGSLFTVRAVLPDVDATDERPTLIEYDGAVASVLSGKICTAVAAARALVESTIGALV